MCQQYEGDSHYKIKAKKVMTAGHKENGRLSLPKLYVSGNAFIGFLWN